MAESVIENGAVTVDGTAYPSPAVDALLSALGETRLVLANAVVTADGDGSRNFTVTGDTQVLGQAVAGATLYMDVDQQPLQFQLGGALPQLAVQTLEDRGILPAGTPAAAAPLLALTFAPAEVAFDSDGEVLWFGQLASSLTLPLLDAAQVAMENVGFEIMRGYTDGRAALRVHATIAVGGTRGSAVLEIPLGGALATETWTLTVPGKVQLGAGLADLLAFMEQTGVGEALHLSTLDDLFPPVFHDLSTLTVSDFTLNADPSPARIRMMVFELGSGHPFQVAGDWFVIERVGMRATVDLARSTPAFGLQVTGKVRLDDEVTLDVSVVLPENWKTDTWVFSAEGSIDLRGLSDVSLLPIATPPGELGFPSSMLTVTELQLHHFEVDFNPTQPGAEAISDIAVDVGLIARFELVHGLAVSDPTVRLDLQYPFAGSKRVLTGSIAGSLQVGGIQFGLSATKSETGWAFACTTESGSLQIGDVFQALADQFGVTLPESIRGIVLTDLELTFTTTAPAPAPGTTGTTTGVTETTTGAGADTGTTGAASDTTSPKEASALVFRCTGTLPIDGKEAAITVFLTVDKDTTGAYDVVATGTLSLPPRTFALAFSKDKSSTMLLAAYGKVGGETLLIREDLVDHVSAALGELIPSSLEIDFQSALFAFDRVTDPPATDGSTGSTGSTGDAGTSTGTGTPRNVFVFGIDVAAGLDLTGIPLIGSKLPDDAQVKVDSLQLAVSSGPLSQAQVADVNALLLKAVSEHPITPLPATGLGQGVNLGAAMLFGGEPQTVSVPAVAPGTTPAPAPTPATPPANVAPSDGAQWITLQKAFGPVHFNRVGVKYADGTAWFLLDAALSAGGLTLSMEGLGFGSKLDRFDPQFDIKGIGIDYASGPVEIGGAFIVQHLEDDRGEPYDEYDGAAVLRTEELTLSALGSYADYEGHPSLFVYAVLDYPLGGPAFFFVTGLAAGFGYNRALTMPTLDGVSRFPLVTAAMNGAAPPQSTADVTRALQSLSAYLTPQVGEVFLTAGIRFTSFKLVDSFLLAVVSFGDEFEVDVLGLSTLVLPTPVPGEPAVTPLAEVQMALRATYQPAHGFLGISAQLTSASFLVSRACHLTGGFAFYCWFSGEHAGDFVISLGGYHPDFKVPSHYPTVPRLGLSWQVSRELSVQGGLYGALTPSLMMAGGEIKAAYHDGNLQAWFTAGMDLLIGWKPYHYDFKVHVDVGVKYTYHFFGKHHINVDVSADLHVWGPEFSGKVHIDLDVVSFSVSFGADQNRGAAPITWERFTASFLPAATQVCTVAVAGGLLIGGSGDDTDLGVIDPRRFRLVTDAVIPSTAAHLDGDVALRSGLAATVDGSPLPFTYDAAQKRFVQAAGASTRVPGALGIGPVGVPAGMLSSTQTITVERETEPGAWVDVTQELGFTPVLKNVPYAMWGSEVTPDTKSPRMVQGVVSGFEVTPAAGPAPGATAVVDRDNLRFDQEDLPAAFAWGAADPPFAPSGMAEDARRTRIADTLASGAAAQARADLCAALGLAAPAVDAATAKAAADAFLAVPEFYAAAG
jgi:hypothetical protein